MTFWILCGAAVFSAALGMALICCGRRQFGACTSETQGVVVDIYRNANFEGDSYAPVVEFHAGGQTVRGKARTEKTGGRSRVPFEVGDRVNLRYNPDNPRQFLICRSGGPGCRRVSFPLGTHINTVKRKQEGLP